MTAGETTLIEWKNIPITAQIQIVKKSADYNSTNGLPAGTLQLGIAHAVVGRGLGLPDGIAAQRQGLGGGQTTVVALDGVHQIPGLVIDFEYSALQQRTGDLEHEGQILRFEVTNKSLTTGVSITKTGPKEERCAAVVSAAHVSDVDKAAASGQTGDGGTLDLGLLHRLNTIVTGTYNFPGTYKITYRVNGGEYRTLADNLSTRMV